MSRFGRDPRETRNIAARSRRLGEELRRSNGQRNANAAGSQRKTTVACINHAEGLLSKASR